VNEHSIGTGLCIGRTPPQRFVTPQAGNQRLGPRYHHRATGESGSFDLALKLLNGH